MKKALIISSMAVLLSACVSRGELYYAPSMVGNYTLTNAQKIRGENCFFENPQNAVISEFKDNVLLEAALLPAVTKTENGKKQITSTVLFAWVWSREPVRFAHGDAYVSVNDKEREKLELAVNLQTSERVMPVNFFEVRYKRRPHLKGEKALARAAAFVDLNEIKPENVTIQLPPVLSGKNEVRLPTLYFTKMSGLETGLQCSL